MAEQKRLLGELAAQRRADRAALDDAVASALEGSRLDVIGVVEAMGYRHGKSAVRASLRRLVAAGRATVEEVHESLRGEARRRRLIYAAERTD